jgi:nucleoside-diphosphate-sugar epimerase
LKKILLTGASGFVGRHCLSHLAGSDWEVHAVSRSTPDELKGRATWHRHDLLDAHEVSGLIRRIRPSHLLHLAWCTEPGEYWTSLENFRWVRATIDLLTEFRHSGGERVVAAGTCAEYEWNAGTCSESRTPLVPATTYGACKHHLRGLLAAFCARSGLSGAWARIFFLYGPHEHSARLVPSVVRALLRKKPARCTHGRQVRDLLYVDDVARALVAVLRSGVEGPVNIASGEPVALRDVVLAVADKLGARDLVQFGALDAPADEPQTVVADVARLRREVGWNPGYTLDLGLDRTIAHWKERLSNDATDD